MGESESESVRSTVPPAAAGLSSPEPAWPASLPTPPATGGEAGEDSAPELLNGARLKMRLVLSVSFPV